MRNQEKDLQIFKKHVGILQQYFEKHYVRRFEYPSDDHFAFMLLCFLSKQREHLESTITLVNANLYSDAMIIARNMIEGIGNIFWVSLDMNKRALRWRKYCVVTDYRISLKKANGDKTKIDKLILELLETEGKEYLLERLRKPKVQKNNLPSDPYKQFWRFDDDGNEVNIYSLFLENDKELYNIYTDMSDWVHWNVSRIGTKLIREKSEVGYLKNPVSDGCFALSSAFLSMFYLMDVVNKYLKLGYESSLENISNDYRLELKSAAI